MALKAGRVGVKPSEVTKGGKIKGGGGGSPYVLPVATATTLGGVKPVVKTEAMTKQVGVDSEGRLYTEPSGGGGGVLGGTTNPSNSEGNNGDIYIKYTDISLPSGYIPLEYIESNGTQKIDTGVPARVQLKAVIDCKWESSGDQTVLGGNSNANDNAVYLGYNSTNSKTYVGYASSWHDFVTGAVDRLRHVWEIDLKTGTQSIIVDGEVTATTSDTFAQTTSSVNLFLFSRSDGNMPFSGKIYNVKIYDYLDNESLIRDFVPVKRDSDDVLGLYDRVNDVFYTNSGTGTFTAGQELSGTTPIDAAYLKVNGSWIILEDGNWDDVNTGDNDNQL